MSLVAIQGIRGSYSEAAAQVMVGQSAVLIERDSFEDVVDMVLERKAEIAVLPLRNKIVGHITGINELLNAKPLRIVEEYRLAIDHQLIGTPTASLHDVTTVFSHIEALRQCGRFLAVRPYLKCRNATDTASSVRDVVEAHDVTAAAIGSARAAEIYGGRVICGGIADEAENWTTFGLIVKVGGRDHA